MNMQLKYLLAVIPLAISTTANADVIHADDVIITGSACIGLDCVNNENFGFDTIRLKENNLRIKFEDTSTGSFPSNDWQLTANDSANGGQNKFSIEDITGGKVPFTVLAGAPTNSMYVYSNGNVGLGTPTPVLDLHIVNGNTPAIRLEQNNSSGFTAQTWDIGSNETNFFIRDVTGGSRLPFKIRPGAPTGSLDILASGDVSFGSNLGLGTGTTAPAAAIHIKKTNDPQIRFDENNVAANTWNLGITDVYSNMFTVLNSANPLIGYALNSTGDIYMNNGVAPIGGKYAWHLLANGNVEQTGNLWVGGDITAQGTVSGSSSRALKNNINIINGDAILRLISKLDVYSWSYIKDSGKITHIGPMAEEFFETFNVGIDNKHISPTDTSGISLAAIKALMDKLEMQDAKIAELETKLTELQQH